jgi:LytS/YehU family sensor histidine kinase
MTILFFILFFAALYLWLQRGKRKALQEVNLKKEFAEIKLNALQSQLNSHFIYNSLNAIQNFILNKDEITASEYMSKFAKLIRLFLESSRSKQAPLQKEIELITIYTSLEKLRFDDKFDIAISTEKINNMQAPFPTNLIQPFIENAILHGLLHKLTKGFLNISFFETDQEVCCTIEDNGVGREQSEEINKHRKRKSFGMDIIQDKMANIEHLHEKKISIEIVDKTPPTHLTTGTIVNIRYKK